MAAPNLGQGIDRGNYRRRNGITPPAVQGKAAGAVAQTVFFGTATGPVTHATTGALTGQGSAVVGSAARVAGTVTHATTGALTGPGSTVAGTAARTRQFATSGTLTGPGTTLAGSARHNIPHPATGTLTGPGSTLAGASARTRAHPTTGTLTGQGSALAGSAARTLLHATTGVLAGSDAILVGSAARAASGVTHDTSGALVGPGAIIVGEADPEIPYLRGEGWGIGHTSKPRNFKRDKDDREQLRKAILSAIEPVSEKEAKVVNVKGEVAVVTKSQTITIPTPPKFDSGAVARMVMSVLEAQGIEAKRVREIAARKQARIALEAIRRENERRLRKRRRDEEILLLM